MADQHATLFATSRIAVIFLACLIVLGASSSSNGNYSVIRKIPIPGQGSWDYLTIDDAARRLYVSHGTQVEVLDVDSGAIVGKIENTLVVHGIAIAADVGRGFVSDGQSYRHNLRLENAEDHRRSAHWEEARCHHLRFRDRQGFRL